MTDSRTNKEQPDRGKIDVKDAPAVRYWTKHFNISREDLQKAIGKVGN